MTHIPSPNHVRAMLLKNYGTGHTLMLSRDDVLKRHPGGMGCTVYVASGFEWKETYEGAFIEPHEGIRNADQIVQAIMDEAWANGFRPRGFGDVQNETAALREHLKDVRTVAFHILKIKEAAK
jgi:hypothetical protein